MRKLNNNSALNVSISASSIAYGDYNPSLDAYSHLFTDKQLLEAMKLQIGDTVVIAAQPFTIIEGEHNKVYLESHVLNVKGTHQRKPLSELVGLVYYLLPRYKKLGEEKCNCLCKVCPIRSICNGEELDSVLGFRTFYEILECYRKYEEDYFDEELYNILKGRLDKEVR